MIFTPTIINHPRPQIAVNTTDTTTATAQDTSNVTYEMIRNSFGQFVYNAERLYLLSNNIRQLIGTITYQRYDVTGSQQYNSIPIAVDPNQAQSSLYIDLTKYRTLFILNGNSSLSANILPQSTVDLTISSSRIANSFGDKLNSFRTMEEIFRNPNFFERYGNISEIQETNQVAKESATTNFSGFAGDEQEILDDQSSLGVLTLFVVFLASYYLIKNKYVIR